MSKNKKSVDKCFICGRPEDQLEPFPKKKQPDIFLRAGFREFNMDNWADSYECKDCIHVPIFPWETFKNHKIILLYHILDNESWLTPIFTWSDRRIDRILSDEVELTDTEIYEDDYRANHPQYNYEFKDLQPDEVEKIKSAQGKIIIIWPERNVTNNQGRTSTKFCGPPEIIDNTSNMDHRVHVEESDEVEFSLPDDIPF